MWIEPCNNHLVEAERIYRSSSSTYRKISYTRAEQCWKIGNAAPPLLARKIALIVSDFIAANNG